MWLTTMNKPLVTAINGFAAGAGVGLALIGDIALASPQGKFAMAYSKLGATPDGGVSWLLPRLVGLRQAQELCLLNRTVDATEAASIGLVTRVVSTTGLLDEAAALAAKLAQGPTAALGATRRLLLDAYDRGLESHLAVENKTVAEHLAMPDGREGIAAFMEHRPAVFTGDRI
jgi:2-(1,2-epoxy-1,2-dihydrophenyl)acetyl-CoA isomerase